MKYRNLPTYIDQKTIERFTDKILVNENGCWLWQGHLDKKGYGKFQYGRKAWAAHRFAFAIMNMDLPCDKQLNHPIGCQKHCCNPRHLEIVTNRENILYARDCENGIASQKLTRGQVEEIKRCLCDGTSSEELAKIYKVSKATISCIRIGDRWGDVLPELTHRTKRICGSGGVHYCKQKKRWQARLGHKHIKFCRTKELAEEALQEFIDK